VLRQGYFGFKRPGDYFVVGADVFRDKPVQFWVKLPLDPAALRDLGLKADDPYPALESRWDPQNRQWYWDVPSIDEVPDVDPAIELTAQYQPESGPMKAPQANL
jgi:hypothetical protein